MLDLIRNYSVGRKDIDEVIALCAITKMIISEYKNRNEDVPTFLTDQLSIMDSDIRTRTKDRKLARLRELENDIDRMKSREEKKAERERTAQALRVELGLEEPAPTAVVTSVGG